MSGFVPYAFTDAQFVDIRRFCGYPARADGNVLFPAPWVNVQYLALEYRLQHMSQSEGAVVITTYLTNLYVLETAIVTAAANLDTDQAAVWKHNRDEVPQRAALFDAWRRRLCAFMGIQPGPDFVTAGGGGAGSTVAMVV
jgi:hypothetical protein